MMPPSAAKWAAPGAKGADEETGLADIDTQVEGAASSATGQGTEAPGVSRSVRASALPILAPFQLVVPTRTVTGTDSATL